MGFNNNFNSQGGATVLTDLEVDGTTLVVDETNNRLGIGTAAPGTQLQLEGTAPYVTLKNDTSENTAGGCESKVIFEDHGNNALGQIEVSHVGSSDDEKGQLILKTNNDSGLQTALTISEAQAATFAGSVSAASLSTTTTAVIGTDATLGTAGNTTAVALGVVANTGTYVGKELKVSAGSSTTGGNNLNGGDLVLESGGGDGTGTSSMQFRTKVSGTDAAAERMRIHTDGNVGIGDATPGTLLQATSAAPYITLKNSTAENSDGGCEGRILFEDHADAALAQIEGSHSGSSDDTKGKLTLSTHTGSALTAAVTINEEQVVSFAGPVEAALDINLNTGIADENVSGITANFTAGEALVRGEVVYFKASDSKMWKAVATAAATARCVAMAAADISADAAGPFLLQGFLRDAASFPTYTIGGALYTPEAEQNSENVPEQAAPDSDGDFVQVIGWAFTGDMVYFNPSGDIIEVA